MRFAVVSRKFLCSLPLVLYFFFCSFSPSSKILAFPIGQALFFAAIICFVFYLAANNIRINKRIFRTALSLGAFASFLISFFLLGIAKHGDVACAKYELQAFIAAISMPHLYFLFNSARIINFRTFFFAIWIGNFAYCVLKVIGIATSIVSGFDMLGFMRKIFGLSFLGGIVQGGGISFWLYRIQTINDSLCFFLMFFMLIGRRIGIRIPRTIAFIYFFFGCADILTAYSRYLFAIGGILLAVYSMLSKKRIYIIGSVCALFIIGFMLFDFSPITDVIAFRFNGDYTARSDQERDTQIRDLVNAWSISPFLGNGIGAYVADNIRNSNRPYMYEVQWISFLMKFGLTGMGVLVIYCLVFFRFLQGQVETKFGIFLTLMYALFLAGGITNPYLLSTASGLLFTLFFASAKESRYLETIFPQVS
jgi:hypothetical protein